MLVKKNEVIKIIIPTLKGYVKESDLDVEALKQVLK